jgi:hypothetical protein
VRYLLLSNSRQFACRPKTVNRLPLSVFVKAVLLYISTAFRFSKSCGELWRAGGASSLFSIDHSMHMSESGYLPLI